MPAEALRPVSCLILARITARTFPRVRVTVAEGESSSSVSNQMPGATMGPGGLTYYITEGGASRVALGRARDDGVEFELLVLDETKPAGVDGAHDCVIAIAAEARLLDEIADRGIDLQLADEVGELRIVIGPGVARGHVDGLRVEEIDLGQL